jgi:hypothetical protein
VRKALHGGFIAAAIYEAIATYVRHEPSVAALDQPDVFKLHLQFVRGCEATSSTINITPVKTGGAVSVFQVQLSQKDQLKVLALVTTTNFTKSLGPSHPTTWKLHPPPAPIPDFSLVENGKSEPNWLSMTKVGEVLSATEQLTSLQPRAGLPHDGIIDTWSYWHNEPVDATSMAMMTDLIPSMSDTLLRTEGLYDAHRNQRLMEEWDAEHPGEVCISRSSMADIVKASVFNSTVTLDMEFKRRVPEAGLRWVFTRIETRMMEAGRMDVGVTLCDEKMDLVCVAHQTILVLEARRKMRERKPKKASL